MNRRYFLLSLFVFVSFSSFGQKKRIKEIETLTAEWVAANSAHDLERLKPLYKPTIQFYGKTKHLTTCLDEKKAFFDKYQDYSITATDFDIDIYKSGIIRCNFNKHEHWGGQDRKTRMAYLLFEESGKKYLISAESDLIIDSNRGVTPQLGEKKTSTGNGLFLAIGIVGGIVLAFLLYRIFSKKKTEPHLPSENNMMATLASNETQQENNTYEGADKAEPVITPVTAQSIANPESGSNSEKGYEFEKWVVSRFPKLYYEIKEWRSDKYHEGRFATTNMLPDLEIVYRHKNRVANFAVECKWRGGFQNGKIEWSSPEQLNRYKEFESTSSKPVFVVIGVGGTPDSPQSLFSIPLREIKSTILYQNQLRTFYKTVGKDFFFDSYNNILS